MRILFVTSSLDGGGAERQLLALSRGLAARGHQIAVASSTHGDLEPDFRTDLALYVLGPAAPLRLAQLVRSWRPDIIHGYLPRGNCLAALARPARRSAQLVFGVRATTPERLEPSPRVRALYALEARLSRRATTICNSEEARHAAMKRGFPAHRMHVIPNGVDTTEFRPDPQRRAEARRAWGFDDSILAVGRVAGLRPIKDYPTFLRAAALIVKERENVRFVCVGGGQPAQLAALQQLAAELRLDEQVIWHGSARNTAELYPGMDLLVSSSLHESSPNVLIEAMACGLDCVATDAGASRRLLGSWGTIVAPADERAMAAAVLASLADSRRVAGEARKRVEENFSLDSMIDRSESLLAELAAPAP